MRAITLGARTYAYNRMNNGQTLRVLRGVFKGLDQTR